MTTRLSVDAMGGDNAPKMVIAALSRISKRYPDAEFIVFGDEDRLQPHLRRFPRARERCEVRHTDKVVGSAERPSVALRTGYETSMRLAIDAVADGEAEGVVSAGNTGALMAMAKFVLGTLPGIDRPAIATVCPTMRGRTVLLDLGANVECSAQNLVQFAIMGEVFAREVLRLETPSVGILNVGEEHLKGNQAVQKAAALLRDSGLAIRFHGFVEGGDISAGTVDVIVTDGFTGNIALKAMEGTARLYSHFLREALRSSILARAGFLLAWPALSAMRRRVDPRQYDGAMFLGLNGVCVKSHGSTDAIGFSNALAVAINLIADRVNEGIKQDFAVLQTAGPSVLQVASGS